MVCKIRRNPIEAISPPSGIVAQRPEQAVLHQKAEQADEDEANGDGDEERHAQSGIKGDDRIGAGHVKLAMGEVDDAHHAEDEHQPDGDERHVARGVGRVHDGLKEKLGSSQGPAIRPASDAVRTFL